jgi:pimeloyl-ACP methyl ester carboxylesterase
VPTAVISYGAADTPLSWILVRGLLEPSWDVVIPHRSASLDPVAQLVAAIEAAGEPVVLIGHSYGGLLAQEAQARVPALVRRLVLVDGTGPGSGSFRLARAVFGPMAWGARVLAPPLARLRFVERAVGRGKLRLIPEQRAFEAAVDADYAAVWRETILVGLRDRTAARELADLIPAARRVAVLSAPECEVAIVHSSRAGRMSGVAMGAVTAYASAATVVGAGDRFHNVHMVRPLLVANQLSSDS